MLGRYHLCPRLPMSASSSLDALRRSSLLQHLPEETLAQLAAVTQAHTFGPGEVLSNPGGADPALAVLVSGTIRVVATASSGELQNLAMLGPGECIGEVSLIEGQAPSVRLEAHEPSE